MEAGALTALPRIIAQACLLTRHPEPGPVQLNCRARKPLEPAAPKTEGEAQFAASITRLLETGVALTAVPEVRANESALQALVDRLGRARRAVIACGPLSSAAGEAARSAVEDLSRAGNLPLFAEVTSQMRFGTSTTHKADALGWLLGPGAPDDLVPDLVLRVGAPLTSAAIDGLFARTRPPELHLLVEHGFPDPLSAARSVVLGPVAASAQALAGLLGARGNNPAQREYAQRIDRENARVWRACATEFDGEAELIEPEAVRLAVAELPDGAQLMVGNSLPVREVDAYVPSHGQAVRVIHQRGANGIDGLVSGAAGAATAANAATLLLLGDVSLAHDLGGLSLLRRVSVPMVVVVLDNGGGRIFEHLPVNELFDANDDFERLFVTPPELALEHAGPLFGIPYAAPASRRELQAVLRQAFAKPGPTLVHVCVPPHSAKAFRERLRRRVDAMLRGAGA
jgi:2-succinyl-5-enolpyruvyl-6-hydroxy-3-cyclohexene-1-carboxylate synthase